MIDSKKIIDEEFGHYAAIKIDDYNVHPECLEEPMHLYGMLLPLLDDENEKVSQMTLTDDDGKDYGITIMHSEIIERLHPNNIDNKYFWKKLEKEFELASVCGSPSKNKEECNKKTLSSAYHSGILHMLVESLTDGAGTIDGKMLEIGVGFGNVLKWIKKYPFVRYWGIDINPLIEHENVFECDGRSIPSNIRKRLDVVYSFNVFQHISKEDRSCYYRDAFKHLRKGGKLLFGLFAITPENEDNKRLWGWRDLDGNSYTHFFGQFTEIDHVGDIIHELKNDIGFSDVKYMTVGGNTNTAIISAKK